VTALTTTTTTAKDNYKLQLQKTTALDCHENTSCFHGMTKSGRTAIENKKATAKGKSGKRIDCSIDCHTLAGSQ
jgi:hypothetical protein